MGRANRATGTREERELMSTGGHTSHESPSTASETNSVPYAAYLNRSQPVGKRIK